MHFLPDTTLTTDDLSKQFLRCIPKKGSTSHEKLIQDNSHGPPVHWLSIALPQNDFRSYVFRSTTHLIKRERKSFEITLIPFNKSINNNARDKMQCLCTCLSRNSRASFSMCPSYRLVVKLIKPILDRPKSVSLMCPIDVISRLLKNKPLFILTSVNIKRASIDLKKMLSKPKPTDLLSSMFLYSFCEMESKGQIKSLKSIIEVNYKHSGLVLRVLTCQV